MTPQSAEVSQRELELEEPEDSGEPAADGVQFHQPARAICRRIAKAPLSTGFTSGHASWPLHF